MKKYLLIFSFILFLAPQLAFAISCSVWFDTNPIVAGQGTYVRWSQSFAGQSPGTISKTPTYHMYLNSVGWVGVGAGGAPSSGAVWVAPGGNTDYTGTAYFDDGGVLYCPATLYVTPADPCPTAIESYWGGGTFLLWSGATRRINAAGYNFCVSNSSGYNYFVSGRSGGEIGSFYNKIPYLPGLTRF
jgi:hypothetical protein